MIGVRRGSEVGCSSRVYQLSPCASMSLAPPALQFPPPGNIFWCRRSAARAETASLLSSTAHHLPDYGEPPCCALFPRQMIYDCEHP